MEGLFFKCVFILYDNTNQILNSNSTIYYTTIERFDECTNLHQSPIEEWPFKSNDDEYVEYVELLYSYYDSEYTKHHDNLINEFVSSDEESELEEDDEESEQDELEDDDGVVYFSQVQIIK